MPNEKTKLSSGSIIPDNAFYVIPAWVFHSKISDGAKLLYARMNNFWNAKEARPFYASDAWIARETGKSPRQSNRLVMELLAAGFISIQHENPKNRYRRTIMPTPRPIPAPPPEKTDKTTAAEDAESGQECLTEDPPVSQECPTPLVKNVGRVRQKCHRTTQSKISDSTSSSAQNGPDKNDKREEAEEAKTIKEKVKKISEKVGKGLLRNFEAEAAKLMDMEDLDDAYIKYTVQVVLSREKSIKTSLSGYFRRLFLDDDFVMEYKEQLRKQQAAAEKLAAHRAAEQMTCPVCGTKHHRTDNCPNCGLNDPNDPAQIQFYTRLHALPPGRTMQYDAEMIACLSHKDLKTYKAHVLAVQRNFGLID